MSKIAVVNVCEAFGHAWIVKPVKGRLVEICKICKAVPEADDYSPKAAYVG